MKLLSFLIDYLHFLWTLMKSPFKRRAIKEEEELDGLSILALQQAHDNVARIDDESWALAETFLTSRQMSESRFAGFVQSLASSDFIYLNAKTDYALGELVRLKLNCQGFNSVHLIQPYHLLTAEESFDEAAWLRVMEQEGVILLNEMLSFIRRFNLEARFLAFLSTGVYQPKHGDPIAKREKTRFVFLDKAAAPDDWHESLTFIPADGNPKHDGADSDARNE